MKTSTIAISNRIFEKQKKSMFRYIKEISIPRVRFHYDSEAMAESFGMAALISMSLIPLMLLVWWL